MPVRRLVRRSFSEGGRIQYPESSIEYREYAKQTQSSPP